MNFVEAATVTSSDGVNFDLAEEIPEDDERRNINKNIEKVNKEKSSSNRSLRDQLSERQEEADEAKREKAKLNFSKPTRGCLVCSQHATPLGFFSS